MVQLLVLGSTGAVFPLFICMVIAYFIGNVSPAILIGRAYGIDIKKEGSGNAGTTNVLRVLGKKAAAMTLVIDIGKGVLAVWVGRIAGMFVMKAQAGIMISIMGPGMPDTIPDFDYRLIFGAACAFAVMCGHIWPAFFRFKGGKGVATAFGALATVAPALGFSALGVVALVVIITKRVSAGSVCGAALAPVFAYLFVPQVWGWILLMAIIVIFKHRSNIGRLIRGEEPKLSFKK